MSAARKRYVGGCFTAFLVMLVVIMLALLTIAGFLYLKDTKWLETRNAQLGNKSDGVIKSLSNLFKKSTVYSNVENKVQKIEEIEPVSIIKDTLKEEKTNIQTQIKQPLKQTLNKETTKSTPVKVSTSKTITNIKTSVTTKKTTQKIQKVQSTKKSLKVSDSLISPVSKNVTIFFIKYDENSDKMVFSKVSRTLNKSLTPLLDTLKFLFEGPSSSEEEKQITSAIPGNVRVLNVTVKDGIATIDLSSNFAEGVGKELMLARVYQIVYTATQFETVKAVKILIEGKTVTNLAGEGVDISKPLYPNLPQPVKF